uniref:Myb/SANT-like DNA-binding domain-containing protein n=1 Tax=Serinus canaria TaxID=9135 RepID=A0A8C9MNN7_SERCA
AEPGPNTTTRALLEIWGEADVQSALDGNFRNSHVYRDVACRLAELGFERTPEQCRIRIKGLKRQYYQARDGLKKNGHAPHRFGNFLFITFSPLLCPVLLEQKFSFFFFFPSFFLPSIFLFWSWGLGLLSCVQLKIRSIMGVSFYIIMVYV